MPRGFDRRPLPIDRNPLHELPVDVGNRYGIDPAKWFDDYMNNLFDSIKQRTGVDLRDVHTWPIVGNIISLFDALLAAFGSPYDIETSPLPDITRPFTNLIHLFQDVNFADPSFSTGEGWNTLFQTALTNLEAFGEGVLKWLGIAPLNAANLFGQIKPGVLSNVPSTAITDDDTELLDNGGFRGAASVDGKGIWQYDPYTYFRDDTETDELHGCVKTTADGNRKLLRSNIITAGPGKQVPFGRKINYSVQALATNLAGSGTPVQMGVETNLGIIVLAQVMPAASPVNTPWAFYPVAGSLAATLVQDWIVPQDGSVTEFCMVLIVDSTANGGTVRFDDARQVLKGGLIGDLQSGYADLVDDAEQSRAATQVFLQAIQTKIALHGFNLGALLDDLGPDYQTWAAKQSGLQQMQLATLKQMLGAFFPSIDTTSGLNKQWQSFMGQIDNLRTLLAGSPAPSASQWAVWLSGALSAIGIGDQSAATAANFWSGNYDAAKQAKAWFDQLLAQLGFTTGSQVGGAIAANSTNISTQTSALNQISDVFNGLVVTPINATVAKVKDWYATQWTNSQALQKRMANNDKILRDWLHQTYPYGSPTDTAATRINGLPTYWGAWNDNMAALGLLNSGAAPTDSAPQGGEFVQAVQTRVIVNEDTLSQVQAKVEALTADDTAVAGRKFVSPANGGTDPSWGSLWVTAVTNANIAARSEKDLFSMSLAQSSAVDLKVTGRYLGGVTLTDDQVVAAVFYDAAKPMAGGNGPRNTFKARMNAAGDAYIYARVNYNNVQLGYAVGGVEQDPWATSNPITVPAGALVELQPGNAAGHRNYQVRVNGQPVITYSEQGTASQMGSSYRGGGQDQLASHGLANDLFQPARIRQFSLRDTNVAAQTFGSSGRWYRTSTAAAAFTTNNAILPITTNILDATPEFASPDITLNPGGWTFDTPGRYRIQFVVRFSAAQTIGMAPALLRNGPGGVTIYAEGVNYGSANMIGLEGSFEFNTLAPVDANGNPTEAWYVGLDMPNASGQTSRSYGVVGDGGGFKTWVSITRIA